MQHKKYCLVKIVFARKNPCCGKKYFLAEKIWPKKFDRKNLIEKIWPKKLGRKNLWPKKLGQKTLAEKIFGRKNLAEKTWPKKFWSKID